MAIPIPVEINHIKEKGLVRITWEDGHVGEYPRLLSLRCLPGTWRWN